MRLLPDAHVLPIATTGRVGGGGVCEVEAMEGFGVLRAAARAGVPALELRAVSNAVGEPDRARWRIDDALAALASSVPTADRRAAMPELPPPLPPETRTVGQVIAETIRAYGEQLLAGAAARVAARDRRPGAHQGDGSPASQAVVLWLCTPLFALGVRPGVLAAATGGGPRGRRSGWPS